MFRGDKTKRATRRATVALDMFQSARNKLSKAIDLLDDATAEHNAKAMHHQNKAIEARNLRDAHDKARTKLSEFLPN